MSNLLRTMYGGGMQDRWNCLTGGTRSPFFARGLLSVGAIVVLVNAFGCATGRVSNLDAYDKIKMNRVVPYPSKDDMRKRAFEVIIVDLPAVGIKESLLDRPRAQVRRALEDIGTEAGATIIDRSLEQFGGNRTEGVLGEVEGRVGEEVPRADYVLATRFSNYRSIAVWKRPFKFLWQTVDDVSDKPGTCTHTAEVEVDIQVIKIGSNDRVKQTYSLQHAVTKNNKDLDPACMISPVTLGVLFERALDEGLSCLNVPLGTLLSPRGHVRKHRKAADADRHIYRISLGTAQGMKKGDQVEILRAQRSMSPVGEGILLERVIGVGEVTDLVRAQVAWIVADPTQAVDEILDGDVVRPLLSEGLLKSLTGPNCAAILTEY
jgi:hypothetical protein